MQEEAIGPGYSLSQGCYDSTSRDRSRVETEAGGLDARGTRAPDDGDHVPDRLPDLLRGDSSRYFQVGHGVFFPSPPLSLLAEAQAEEPSLPSLQDQCEEKLAQKMQEAA